MSIRKKNGKLVWKETNRLPNISDAKLVAIDVETKDPNIKRLGPGGVRGDGFLLGISVSVDGWSGYISLRHPDTDNWDIVVAREWICDVLNTPGQIKVGANIIYDLEWLRAEGFKVSGPFADVQHMEALLDENRLFYSLDSLSKQYLPKRYRKGGEQLDRAVRKHLGDFKGKAIEHIAECPAKVTGLYAELDAVATRRIYIKQLPLLAMDKLERVFDVECRLIPMLLDMRFRGVRIDQDQLDIAEKKLANRTKRMQRKLDKFTGQEVHVNAAQSVAAAFNKMEKKTKYPYTIKTGAPSFRKDWLEAHGSPLSKMVMAVRKTSKTSSMSIDGIKRSIVNGRVYTQFHQMKGDYGGAVTGRFSSSNPNLQQQPKLDPFMGELIRSIYIPEPGEWWWRADYSQIEYRMIVHMSCMKRLRGSAKARRAYKNDPNTNFHSWVSEMINRDYDKSKKINFGLAYVMGEKKLAKDLGLTPKEGRELFKVYHEKVPFIKLLTDDSATVAKNMGYVKTLLGRRRRFNLWEPHGNYNEEQPMPYDDAVETWGKNDIVRAYTWRAMNARSQGSAADVLKLAMVSTYESGVYDVLGIPSLTVHDELDGSMPKTKRAKEALREMKHTMETCVKLKVPLIVEVETGKDWWHVKSFS